MKKLLSIFHLFLCVSFAQPARLLKKIHKDSLKTRSEVLDFLHREGFREAKCTENCPDFFYENLRCCRGTQYVVRKIFLHYDGKTRTYRMKFPFSAYYLKKISPKILKYFQEKGFLFAELKIDSISYRPKKGKTCVLLHASLKKNKQLRIRSIEIEDEKDLFLLGHLARLREEEVFNFHRFLEMETLLKQSDFLRSSRAPMFWIYPDSSVGIRVFVKHVTKNTGDGVVALIPPSGNETKFQFTGNVRLRLRNNLRKGEEFFVKYDKLLNTSQSMLLQAEVPYFGNFPVGAKGFFKLYKQDSSFLRRTAQAGIIWHASASMKIYLNTRQINTSLLNPEPYKETRWPPPPNLDGKANVISVKLVVNKLNNNILPTSGFKISTDFGYGTKKILKNAFLDSLDYDRLLLKQQRNELTFGYKYFFPITRRHNLHLKQEFYTLLQEFYLENDLKFVGGINSVRGFIENEFLASSYLVSSLEYRFFLDAETYIGWFWDHGYLERRVTEDFTSFHLWGTGFSFGTITSIGKIGINYAVGKYPGEPFRWTRGRIHIGFYF